MDNQIASKEPVLTQQNPISEPPKAHQILPDNPKRSKKLIKVLIVIILLLIASSFGGYAFVSFSSKTKALPAVVPTIAIKPSPTLKSAQIPVIKTHTKTPTPTKKVLPTKTIPTKIPPPTSTPSLTPTPTPSDTIPPSSYFLNNSSMTLSLNSDGKICFGFSPPRDNFYSYDVIESHYRVDGGSWSNYQKILASVCEALSVGQHTVEVQSKDPAGNVENPPTKAIINVEPNIPITY